MPLLDNPRYEAFAKTRAKGARLDDAYEDAGFAPGKGHASRLAARPEVAERIAELRAAGADRNMINAADIATSLMRLAKAAEALATPAGFKEARELMLVAQRLHGEIAERRRVERDQMDWDTRFPPKGA